MTDERTSAKEAAEAAVTRRAALTETLHAQGRFEAVCYGPDGKERWRDTIENTICTEGKNLMLDTAFSGSNYTTAGPYMGLIAETDFTDTAPTDTAAQINGSNGWLEAGGVTEPAYSGGRPTGTWGEASGGSKALASPANFTFYGGPATIKGCFILFGPDSTSTKDEARGTLWSAGVFTSGDKAAGPGDTLSVSYSTSL